jgi:isoamylase
MRGASPPGDCRRRPARILINTYRNTFPTGIRQRGTEATLLLILNAHHDPVRFTLPVDSGGTTWRMRVDTNIPDEQESSCFAEGTSYSVTGRSLLLFELQK